MSVKVWPETLFGLIASEKVASTLVFRATLCDWSGGETFMTTGHTRWARGAHVVPRSGAEADHLTASGAGRLELRCALDTSEGAAR